MKRGNSFTRTAMFTLFLLTLSLCPAGAQEEEEEHMLERPNPVERRAAPGAGAGFGSKVREIDPSAPVVAPGNDALRVPDPAGPVVSPGGSKGNQGARKAFQPQPEPPGSPFRGTQVLSSGERVQFVATGMKTKAYIMKGGKRVPLADGAYSLGGGEGFSVKMGVVMEDKIPGGGPLSPGKGKMAGEKGIIIVDSEPDVTKQSSPQAIIDDGKPGGGGAEGLVLQGKPATKAIIDDGKPGANSSLGNGGGGGVGPRGIIINDKQLQQR